MNNFDLIIKGQAQMYKSFFESLPENKRGSDFLKAA